MEDSVDQEYHLTQSGWVTGSRWTLGELRSKVKRPDDAIETWTYRQRQQSQYSKEVVSWERSYRDPNVTDEEVAGLIEQLGVPEKSFPMEYETIKRRKVGRPRKYRAWRIEPEAEVVLKKFVPLKSGELQVHLELKRTAKEKVNSVVYERFTVLLEPDDVLNRMIDQKIKDGVLPFCKVTVSAVAEEKRSTKRKKRKP